MTYKATTLKVGTFFKSVWNVIKNRTSNLKMCFLTTKEEFEKIRGLGRPTSDRFRIVQQINKEMLSKSAFFFL